MQKLHKQITKHSSYKSNKAVTNIFTKPLTFFFSCGIIIMFLKIPSGKEQVTLRAVCQIGIVITMTLNRTYIICVLGRMLNFSFDKLKMLSEYSSENMR